MFKREKRGKGCGGGRKERAAGLLSQKDGKNITENGYFVDDSAQLQPLKLISDCLSTEKLTSGLIMYRDLNLSISSNRDYLNFLLFSVL